MWADEQLRLRGGSMSPEEAKRLTFLATGSEAAADDAWTAAADAYLRMMG